MKWRPLIKPKKPVINRLHPLARGLTGAFLFDGKGKTVKDYSGFANDAVFGSANDWVQTAYGPAATSDGTVNSKISANLVSGGHISATEFTHAVLFRPTSFTDSYCTIIHMGSTAYRECYVKSTGGIAIYVKTTGGVGSVSIDPILGFTVTAGEWYLLSYSYSALGGLFYFVDGYAAGNKVPAGDASAITAGQDLDFFWDDTTTPRGLSGSISAMYHWKRTLTWSEHLRLYRDPFEMFRRPVRRAFIVPSAPSFTPKFRKTLSGIGGRVGDRQRIGW